MWFDALKNRNVVMNYEVHNDSGKYDEDYSESSSEFMVSPAYAGGSPLSGAQESIISAIFNKLKNRIYADDYNDCSYPQVYDQD